MAKTTSYENIFIKIFDMIQKVCTFVIAFCLA